MSFFMFFNVFVGFVGCFYEFSRSFEFFLGVFYEFFYVFVGFVGFFYEFSRSFDFFLGVFYEFFLMVLLVLLVFSMNFLGVLSFF